MFDAREFMDACEAHGLATRAYRATVGDPGFVCGFVTPDVDILEAAVVSARIDLEYATAHVSPALTKGERLTIGAVVYRVTDAPRRTGDGTFTRVSLEEVRA